MRFSARRVPALPSLALLSLLLSPVLPAQKRPFDVDGLLRIQRLSDPQISPDGKTVAFAVSVPDVAANKSAKSVWSVPLEGGTPRKLVDSAERPRWAPDGKRIYYSSGGQIWAIDPDGGSAKQITKLSVGAADHLISSDGKTLLAHGDVYPSCATPDNVLDDACNAHLAEEEKSSKVSARVFTGLLYRHWTAWQGKTRSHLLAIPVGGGKVIDLTPGDKDVPGFSLGGPDDYAISPDSTEVAFAMNADPVAATSTNTDIYVVSIGGGQAQKITGGMGADSGPLYSPDGKYLAFRSQSRGGYESDKWRLAVLERANGRLTLPTEAVDRSVESFTWSKDSTRLFFGAVDRGHQAIQFVGVEGGGVRIAVTGNETLDDVQFTPDGKTMVFTRQSGSGPVEICKTSSGGKVEPLTHLNDGLLAGYQLTPYEDFWVTREDGTQIQSFVVKPPDYDPKKKYPVLLQIHGGPQGEWGESWTYRWNSQVFAAAGYVVVLANPRGSIGYGQKFTDDINQDWGGKPYDDLMAITDYVTKLPYVDANRMAAAGGSYGGYMVNWLLGHTDRFKCFVSHAGIYDLRSEAESTEELWFPLWEFGGMPWDNPEVYDRWSPSKFTKEFKTPTLVVHGELDFRIPYSQALQLYTALQMRKVPSKLLIYPDEGHWVLKPQNSKLWYGTFLDWVNNWTKAN